MNTRNTQSALASLLAQNCIKLRGDVSKHILLLLHICDTPMSIHIFPNVFYSSIFYSFIHSFVRSCSQSSNKGQSVLSFSDVVDEDERALERRVRHVFVGWFVESIPFR